MKKIGRIISSCGLISMLAMGLATVATSCNSNRYITYEDGELDTNEISLDEASDILHLNSEIDLDDRERY